MATVRDLIVVGFDGTHAPATAATGPSRTSPRDPTAAAAAAQLLRQGDYDRDSDLDLRVALVEPAFASGGQLWRNDGSGNGFATWPRRRDRFSRRVCIAGLDHLSFTGNFVDTMWLDPVVTVDFMGSRVLPTAVTGRSA